MTPAACPTVRSSIVELERTINRRRSRICKVTPPSEKNRERIFHFQLTYNNVQRRGKAEKNSRLKKIKNWRANEHLPIGSTECGGGRQREYNIIVVSKALQLCRAYCRASLLPPSVLPLWLTLHIEV